LKKEASEKAEKTASAQRREKIPEKEKGTTAHRRTALTSLRAQKKNAGEKLADLFFNKNRTNSLGKVADLRKLGVQEVWAS